MTQPLVAICQSGVKEKGALLENITIIKLAKHLSNVEIGTKDGSYFLRTKIDDTSKGRSDANTTSMASVLVLDADSAVNPDTGETTEGAPCPHKVHETLKSADINHLICSSYSHGIKGNRYRVLFQTDRPYNEKELPPTVSHALALCGGKIADVKENCAWSQPWYLPRKPDDSSEVVLLDYKAGKPIPVQQPLPNFTTYKPQRSQQAGLSPVDAYNAKNTIESELSARGDTRQGSKWLYADSISKEAGISVQDNKMFSHHGSDPLSDGNAHDCFDVMQSRLALSFNDAFKHAAQQCGIEKPKKQKKVEGKKTDRKSPVENLKPYNHSVEGGALLAEMVSLLNKYVYLPEGMDVALACWCLGSYCFSSWQLYPKLLITSPEKRCGKTTLLEVIEGLAFSCFPVSNVSASAVFRLIEEHKPTLLIDEADTFLKDNDDLNGIINAGHKKRLANVLRTEKDGNEFHVRNYSVWSPMVLAGIGTQRDTLHDRSIHIEMERKLPSYKTEKLPFRFFEDTCTLRAKCIRWAQDHKKQLRKLTEIPNHGNDRAQDNWQPLITVAANAKKVWQDRIIKVYRDVMLQDAPEENAGITLLRDIQAIFKEEGCQKMASAVLIDALIKTEGSPWGEWRRGQPMTQISLSRLLKPFKIKPKQIRFDDKNHRGFEAKQFENSFIRYISPVQSATTLQLNCDTGYSGFQSATRNEGVALQKGLKPRCDRGCSVVALQKGEVETTV